MHVHVHIGHANFHVIIFSLLSSLPYFLLVPKQQTKDEHSVKHWSTDCNCIMSVWLLYVCVTALCLCDCVMSVWLRYVSVTALCQCDCVMSVRLHYVCVTALCLCDCVTALWEFGALRMCTMLLRTACCIQWFTHAVLMIPFQCLFFTSVGWLAVSGCGWASGLCSCYRGCSRTCRHWLLSWTWRSRF